MKVFLDTNIWLSATVFSGLCEAILTESAQRNSLLTTRLVQREAHEVLTRKFPHMPHAKALFDAIWAEANCVSDVDEPKNDNDERLVRAALGAQADIFVTGDRRILDWGERGRMKILNPRGTWTQLYAAKGEF